MIPANFPEANVVFGPPEDLDESQCGRIPAYAGTIQGGHLDGSQIVVVAWLPTDEERAAIAAGQPVYLSMIGGLAPHTLNTDFKAATLAA